MEEIKAGTCSMQSRHTHSEGRREIKACVFTPIESPFYTNTAWDPDPKNNSVPTAIQTCPCVNLIYCLTESLFP